MNKKHPPIQPGTARETRFFMDANGRRFVILRFLESGRVAVFGRSSKRVNEIAAEYMEERQAFGKVGSFFIVEGSAKH